MDDTPEAGEVLAWPRSDRDGTPLGIDLSKHANDVNRIVCAHFAHGHSLNMEDLVQEVYAAILRKNRQPCAFDPRRSTFAHYVFIVARSTLLNLLDKEKRADPLMLYMGAEPIDEREPIDAFEEADEAASRGVDITATRASVRVVRRVKK
jgi:DNA-directed RNA polymerase specialized sigma24 family protein